MARMRPTGGAPELVHKIDQDKNEVGAEWPFALPGGKGAARAHPAGGAGAGRLRHRGGEGPRRSRGTCSPTASTPGTPPAVCSSSPRRASSSPSRFDTDKLELTGAPVALLEGIGVRTGGFNVDLSLSRTGTLVYTSGSTLGSRRPFWVSREGLATAGGPGLGPAGPHRQHRALARRQRSSPSSWPGTASPTSGSSSFPPAPSPGSPSATPRACGRPGRPTGATSTSSSTGPAPGSGRCSPTGPTAPGWRGRSSPSTGRLRADRPLARRALDRDPDARQHAPAPATSSASGWADTHRP